MLSPQMSYLMISLRVLVTGTSFRLNTIAMVSATQFLCKLTAPNTPTLGLSSLGEALAHLRRSNKYYINIGFVLLVSGPSTPSEEAHLQLMIDLDKPISEAEGLQFASAVFGQSG